LRPGADSDQQRNAHQRYSQGDTHRISHGPNGLEHRALCHLGQEESGLIVLLYYNIKLSPTLRPGISVRNT
jgi:hypothetical protein